MTGYCSLNSYNKLLYAHLMKCEILFPLYFTAQTLIYNSLNNFWIIV